MFGFLIALVTGAAIIGTVTFTTLPNTDTLPRVVFVHGLLGWGPDKLFGVGGIGGKDYIEDLKCSSRILGKCISFDMVTHYAVVSAVGSNWDRACQLYAQIKGTRTDYGYVHSKRNSHDRFAAPGSTYDYTGRGFYPSWDGSHPIHFIGHSMGGQTSRMLEFFLRKGYAEEVNGTPASEPPVSPLFDVKQRAGGLRWIKSLHTIATPHNGTPLHTALGPGIMDLAKDLITAFAMVGGLAGGAVERVYDFGLEQFGPELTWQEGESWSSYLNRVTHHPTWAWNFTDSAWWDVSPIAANEFNAKTDLGYSDTYYFAHSTDKTVDVLGNQVPEINQNEIVYPFSLIIGAVSTSPLRCLTGFTCAPQLHTWCGESPSPAPSASPRPFCYGDSWESNDGLVPRRSGRGPEIGYTKEIYSPPRGRPTTNYCGYYCSWGNTWCCQQSSWDNVLPGKWYEMYHERDHFEMIGLRLNPTEYFFYDNIFTTNTVEDEVYERIRDEIKFVLKH